MVYGDDKYWTFSFDNEIYYDKDKQIPCHLIYTQPETHKIIKDNLNKSSMYGGLSDIKGVSRSGYYAWVAAISDRARREAEDRADFKLILIAYNKRGYTKGARGIYMCLLHMDPSIMQILSMLTPTPFGA